MKTMREKAIISKRRQGRREQEEDEDEASRGGDGFEQDRNEVEAKGVKKREVEATKGRARSR